jgi:hypothetical protein
MQNQFKANTAHGRPIYGYTSGQGKSRDGNKKARKGKETETG